jgi:hypothetical protein
MDIDLYKPKDPWGRIQNSRPKKNLWIAYATRLKKQEFDRSASRRKDGISSYEGDTDRFYQEFCDFLRSKDCGDQDIRRFLLLHERFIDEHGYRLVNENAFGVPRSEPKSDKRQPSWVEQVRADQVSKPIALPNKAPALWKRDKQPGDTPPSFIKQHYGAWLRADALGITRPDIKRLDPELYVALANWLRKNELPDDCPLPTRSEVTDAMGRVLSEARQTPDGDIPRALRAHRALVVRANRSRNTSK